MTYQRDYLVSEIINRYKSKSAYERTFSVYTWCVFGNPLFHFDMQSEWIDAQSDDGEQEPLDPVPE